MTDVAAGNAVGNRALNVAILAAKCVIALAMVFVVLVPIYWIAATSIKPPSMIQSWPPSWIPDPITFENYSTVFDQLPVGRFFVNSVIIGIAMVVSNVVLCSLAGYTFARKRFPGRDILFLLIVGSMMVPTAVRLIPDYIITVRLGMLNTYQGIVLPTAVTGFGIFLMRQFFRALPAEIEDAARIDGCTEWGVLFRVVLPMSRPAVASLALFAMVWSFEDVLWPLVVTSQVEMRPLQVGITQYLTGEYILWGPMAAITTLSILPFAIVFLLMQRQFIRGLTAGAVKG
jgi:ABC-type glycerol-3-phosphate transport system permease component